MESCLLELRSKVDLNAEDETSQEARTTFGAFFTDPAVLQLYSFKEPRKRPPFMENIHGARVSNLLKAAELPQWAKDECEYLLRNLASVIYGSVIILRDGTNIKCICDDWPDDPDALTASWPECEGLIDAATRGDVMKLDFMMYNQLDEEGVAYSQTKIVATHMGDNTRREIHYTQDVILAIVNLSGCAVIVTTSGFKNISITGSWEEDNLRLQCRKYLLCELRDTEPMRFNDVFLYGQVCFVSLDKTISPPSLVCVICGRTGTTYLARIGRVDPSSHFMSEIELKDTGISLMLNPGGPCLDYFARAAVTPRIAAVPRFALDDHGRIWIRAGKELRVYNPDFELADSQEISAFFEIYGLHGEVHLYRQVKD